MKFFACVEFPQRISLSLPFLVFEYAVDFFVGGVALFVEMPLTD